MDINEKDIIILDDENRYFVGKKINFENRNYYYISDIDNEGNIKFLYEDMNSLVEIEDNEFLEKVIVKMYDDIDVDDLLREIKFRLEQKK